VPERPEQLPSTEAFGLPTDRFEAAVDALVELRDTGRLLIFLTRRGSVKLVGDISAFRNEFSSRAGDVSIDLEQSKKAQHEIRQLASAIIHIPNPEDVLEYLERIYREELGPKRDRGLSEEFKRTQQPKIEIVSRKVVTEEMRQRAKRLATATGASVEELDYEVVTEREDSFRGKSVKVPFLRMRLRYTEGSKGDFGYIGLFLVSFEGSETGSASGFEFECDLADIDLLLRRLGEAKNRLLKAQEPELEAN